MKQATGKLLGAMGIFGSIGIFVRLIPLPSASIALCRSVLGLAFLLVLMLFTEKKLTLPESKKGFLVLCVSGVALGANWILLFEAYRYTTVATATVCYYLAPIIAIVVSAFWGEKLTGRKILCIAAACIGMVCLSGIFQGGSGSFAGILFGVGAAVLYATVMLLNNRLQFHDAYSKTVVQLSASAAVLLPYILLTQGASVPALEPVQWGTLALVGIVHTGIAYWLYFSAVKDLPVQTVALFSYLDPVISIALSALVLQEQLGFAGIVGAVLILGSALWSELPRKA